MLSSSPPVAYPEAPGDAPPLVPATRAYKLRVVGVLAALLGFFAFYAALLAGSVWAAIAIARACAWDSGGEIAIDVFLVSGPVLFFIFLLKGLLRRGHTRSDDLLEVTELDQPELFAFLHKVAAEAGAQRPHRVYLTSAVNAAVFTPQTFWTLLFPPRKNLLLGLGLLNALDVSELKAVCAHEFGHFSQSSSRLASYVYTANEVVRDLVFGRDWLDVALSYWMRIDLRLSFPAWGVYLLLVLTRRALALGFKGLTLADFALMRQMEFDADQCAVRVAGSDAIVSALWKSERASLAWRHAEAGLSSAAEHGRFTDDVFFHQEKSLARLETLLGARKEQFAFALRTYRPGPELHFTAPAERVSTLWSTHPPHHEREANAKRDYVPAKLVGTPATELLRSLPELRRELTRRTYAGLGIAAKAPEAAEKIETIIEEERGQLVLPAAMHQLYDVERQVVPGNAAAAVAELDASAAAGTLDLDGLRAEAHARLGPELAKRSERAAVLRAELAGIQEISDANLGPQKKCEFRGVQTTVLAVLSERPKIVAELEQEDAWLVETDRLLFRWFYAKSGEDPAWRAEFTLRYQLLIALQFELATLRAQTPHVVRVLRAPKGEEEQIHRLSVVTTQATYAGNAVFERLGPLINPHLALLGTGSIRDYVFPDGPLPHHGRIDTSWLQAFMGWFFQGCERLERVHVKNLAMLLALEEKMDPAMFASEGPGDVDHGSSAA